MSRKPRKPTHVSARDWAAVDSPPLSDDMLARMRPVREAAPELIRMQKRRGRPRLAAPKEAIKLRLSAEVLAHFRAGGPGWQTRIDETLCAAVKRSRNSVRSRH